jgi:hypothetical protein
MSNNRKLASDNNKKTDSTYLCLKKEIKNISGDIQLQFRRLV